MEGTPLRVRPLIYLALGIAVFVLLVYWVDPSKLLTQAARIPPISIAGFVASVLGFHLLRSIRWRKLLGAIGDDPKLKNVFWTNMIGYAVNSFIPVRFGGEIARAYIIDSKERFGFFPSLSSVAVERILDLLTIVGLAATAILAYSSALGNASLMAILVITGVLTVAMFGVVIVGSRNLPLTMRGFTWLLNKLPMKKRWRGRILDVIKSSLEGATAIGRDFKLLGLTLFLSILIWITSFLGFYALFLGVGFNAPAAALLVGIMLFQLSFILPSAPGNVGSFEGFLVLVFAGLGLSQADSTLAVGVVSHILNLLLIALLGMLGVFLLGLKFGEVFRIPSIKKRNPPDTSP